MFPTTVPCFYVKEVRCPYNMAKFTCLFALRAGGPEDIFAKRVPPVWKPLIRIEMRTEIV